MDMMSINAVAVVVAHIVTVTCLPYIAIIHSCHRATHVAFLQLEWVNLLCFDEAHHATGAAPYALIMLEFYFHPALPIARRPHVFGMTASPINVKANKSLQKVSAQIGELESMLDSTVRGPPSRSASAAFCLTLRACSSCAASCSIVIILRRRENTQGQLTLTVQGST